MQQNDIHINSPNLPRLVFVLMILAAVALMFSLGSRSVASWDHYGDLDHNSPGTWLGMAMDASQGVLYRPMVSDSGYGGSRYAPLYPVILAGLIRAGVSPVISGFLVGIGATIAIVCGLYVLMRRLGTPAAVAGAMAVFALAAACMRTTVLGIKADLLPLALSLWGLAAVVDAVERRRGARARIELIAGAIFFVLAICAKVTSIFGIGAAVIWLAARRRYRQAAMLGAAWGLGVLLAILIIQWASDGRFVSIFRLCAGGGGGMGRLMKGPVIFFSEALREDHVAAAFWGLAVVVIAATGRWISLPAIFLAITTLGTMAIFGSPGTHLNHLVDVDAAAILAIAALGGTNRRLAGMVVGISVIVALLATGLSWRQMGDIRRGFERSKMESALAEADASGVSGPILSEDPLLPILRGQSPYMLDSFLFRAVRARRPEIAGKLWSDLDHQYFKAVILHGPPDDPDYSSDEGDFGPGFIDRLERNYAMTSVRGSFYIFLPKGK